MPTDIANQVRPPIKSIQFYIDGKCPSGIFGGGIAFIRQDFDRDRLETEQDYSSHLPATSTMGVELSALIAALKVIPANTPTTITTDCGYLTDGLNKYWDTWVEKGMKNAKGQPIAHKELWEEIHELLQGKDVEVVWVGGEDIHPLKDRVDNLAREALAGTNVDNLVSDFSNLIEEIAQ